MKRVKRIETGQDVSLIAPLFANTPMDVVTSPKLFTVTVISSNLAVRLNQQWHSRLPLFGGIPSANYALEYRDHYYGVAIWSPPIARMLPHKEWLELRRMALSPECPHNTATWFLARMERLLIVKFPEVIKLISYQDTEAHHGTIYKAANWIATNRSSGGEWNVPSRRALPQQTDADKIRWEKDLHRKAKKDEPIIAEPPATQEVKETVQQGQLF